jgi:chemotaxis signal transduction protein
MTPPRPEDADGTQRAPGDSGARVEEIRTLEARLVGLKRELLFQAASVRRGDDERSLNFLVFRVGQNLFAAPIRNVEEVVELPALVPLPDAARTIAGLCNYHGRMVAVIDVAELTSGVRAELSAGSVLVICEVPPRAFALLVDEALEVIVAEDAAVTLADEVMTGVLRSAGVLRLPDNATAQIIDLDWLAIGAQLAAILRDDAVTPVAPKGAP